jgi:uncharacterized protein YnzC (UPF0291/DUF896 family)
MESDQDAQMSELPTKQREHELTELEAIDPATLMQAYQEGWLRDNLRVIES